MIFLSHHLYNFYFIIFADDTNILFSHRDPEQLEKVINTELKKISNCFKLNKLSLNIDKTNFMIFKNKHSNKSDLNFKIKIDNTNIDKVEVTKLLGTASKPNRRLTGGSARFRQVSIVLKQPRGTGRNRRSTGGWVLKPPLGILIDNHLSWKSHNSHISKIVSKYNSIIRKIRPSSYSNQDSLQDLPYLFYCTLVWETKATQAFNHFSSFT